MTEERQTLMEALEACVAAAPEKEQTALYDALQAYAEKYRRTYKALKQQPFTRGVLDALEEGLDLILP